MFILLLFVTHVLVTPSCGCQFRLDQMYGGIFADCTGKNLSTIPTDLPSNVTSLDMSKNNIAKLHVSINVTFKSLKYLDVSYNKLSAIQNGTFEKFKHLRELFINNNMLTLDNISFPDDIFQPVQNLQKFHLHNNDQRDVGSYPEDAIGKLQSIKELKIDTFSKTNFGLGFSKLFNLERLILGFRGCKLQLLENGTFENLTNIPIVSAYFDHCPIVKLEIGCFRTLKYLKHLYFSNFKNLQPPKAIMAMYGFRGRNISSIDMNNIFTVVNFRDEKLNERIISNDVLVYLKDVCVEKFSMIANELLWVDTGIFKNTVFSRCIKYLDLSLNDLYGDVQLMFLLAMAPNIVYFNISNHGRGRTGSNTYNVHLTTPVVGFTVPETLEVLDIEGFNFGRGLTLNVIVHVYNAASLRSLSIANSRIRGIESRLVGLENVTFLDISGNNCTIMNPAFYNDFANLLSLNTADVAFADNFLLNHGVQLFDPMVKLTKINLSKNDLRLLSTNIFSANKMEEILLSRNRFESIPFDLKTTPHLKYLDLSFCSLAVLSDTEMKLLDTLDSRNSLTLNLQGNLLSCGCNNLDFILWLYNTNVQVIRRSSYICQMSDGAVTNTSYVRNHYEEIWMSCNGRMSLSVTVALFAVIVLVIVVVYFTIVRKTLIVNLLLRMFGYGSLPPIPTRTDFLNDVYIGYSDADYRYICHTVRNQLEDKHGLKLFIKDRDSIPGGQIADDIINGIDTSWRTILFLTAAFLNDQWCQFTINRVVYSSAQMTRVILVLSDDVMRGDIDPALLNIVEERSIFYADKYKEDDDRLWREISEMVKQ